MTAKEFYAELEAALELDPGTIQGSETLADLPGWDSMGMLSFIAMVDSSLGLIVSASALSACRTVADLAALCPGKVIL